MLAKIKTGDYLPVVYKTLDSNHVKKALIIASRQVKGNVMITF